MKIEQKTADFKIKAADTKAGTFTAVVSVFGNVDSYGDVMQKGAFARTLKEWEEKGQHIPFLWDHKSNDPFAYIGEILEAKETDEGLEVKGILDTDNPQAVQVHKLMKSGRVSQYSFGFMVPKGGAKLTETEEDGYIRELHDVDLLEVSTTLVGANPATRTVEVRHAPEGIEVTAVEEKAEAVFDVKAIDSILDALTNLRDTLDKTANVLMETKAGLEKPAEESEKPEVIEKGSEQTAANDSEKADRDANERKAADLAEAAVTVANLEASISILDIERILGQ